MAEDPQIKQLMNMGFGPKAAAFIAALDNEATTSAFGVVKKSATVNLTSAAVTPPFADLTAAANAYNLLRTDVSNLLTALKAADNIMGS